MTQPLGSRLIDRGSSIPGGVHLPKETRFLGGSGRSKVTLYSRPLYRMDILLAGRENYVEGRFRL